MLVKLNVGLKTLDGQQMIDKDGQDNAIDATLQTAIVNAVLSPLQQGQNEKGTEKVKKYDLAMKVYKSDGEVELSAEDIVLIKERIADVFSPLVVGQCFNLLENQGKEIEKSNKD